MMNDNGQGRYHGSSSPKLNKLDESKGPQASSPEKGRSRESTETERDHGKLPEMIDGIAFKCDYDSGLLYLWGDVEGFTGYEKAELIGGTKNFLDLAHPEDLEAVAACLPGLRERPGKVRRFALRFRKKNGERRHAMVTLKSVDGEGSEDILMGRAVDVTEIREFERERGKDSKARSNSLMAEGVAHEINDMLTAIQGNITLAKLGVDSGDEAFELLTEAERACEHTGKMVERLYSLGSRSEPVKSRIDLSESIARSVEVSVRGTDIVLDLRFPGPLYVEADRDRISDMFRELFENAAQSMPMGGSLEISMERAECRPPGLSPGSYVAVSVKDCGVGIPESHLDRIFEPYFTTKQRGRGQGLAMAYSSARVHGGTITVESELGGGSVFTVYLPCPEPAVRLSVIE